MWDVTIQLSGTGAKSLPRLVAALIVQGQNLSFLLYLGPAFIDDYTHPPRAWRSISLKISVCLQVIGVACSKEKRLIRRWFLQESSKQAFSAVNQLLQWEHVFPHHLLAQGRPPRGCHCSGWQSWHNWNLELRLALQSCFSALHLLSCLTQAL